MGQDELKDLLQQLHHELSKADSLDDVSKALLNTVVDDIQTAIGDDSDEEPHGLADRLKEAAQDYEEDYPQLTEAIGSVASALARLGI